MPEKLISASPSAVGQTALPSPAASSWLIRIPEVFAPLAEEIIASLRPMAATRLGNDYVLLKLDGEGDVSQSEAAMFIQWNLPVHHSWPCNPQKMEGFIEKAAQTLLRKFGSLSPQGIFMGQLHPTPPNPYYKSLASNLRGRTLQLFPSMNAKETEDQDGAMDTLFCLIGKEGLFSGLQSPRACNGLYPGGTKYISQDGAETISRAGAKVAEALHYLLMYRPPLAAGSHWVELGASPGGMTSELLARGFRVTAVDRAPLDERLSHYEGLTFAKADVAEFRPKPGTVYDAVLSDLNGSGLESIQHVIRLSKHLKPSGLVIFTLKMPGVETIQETVALFHEVVAKAARAGLSLLARTHLTYNRREFTLFFEKQA
jgi:23S rRNA (cytidine2498-2'-O)-methyltransferase